MGSMTFHVAATLAVENPLWECEPPNAAPAASDNNLDVLRQAAEIKRVLKRIESEDPLARSHQFAFRVHPENEAVLRQKGFQISWEPPYTRISWTRDAHAAVAPVAPVKVRVV
jgi:hypothetical protein